MTDSSQNPIRVRFAPSPTGLLHIGTARSTLFNWLFAKHNNGTFVLRIEDTDKERSKKEYENDLIKGLKWLGLDWDEGPDIGGPYGPYRQSERGEFYTRYLKKLIEENKAYYCFCGKEDLETERGVMVSQGLPPKYGGKCRHIDQAEAQTRAENGEPSVIRLKVPETEIEFLDLIRGKLRFNTALIGDIIIAKDINTPLFILSNAIDDYEMKITHVIRGEDHISNTPKQILVQKALDFNEIKYAHLPLILAPDRSKLSKRYIETSLNDYAGQGYLPEAVINFLALLGWHPAVDREILSREELIDEFDIRRVQKAGAIFDIAKLDWLNAQYIKGLDEETIFEKTKPFVPEEWRSKENGKMLKKIINLEKERLKKISDIFPAAKFFFELPQYDKKIIPWKGMDDEKIINNLSIVLNEIKDFSEEDFTRENIEHRIMPLTEVWGRGELLWPLRVALSGQEASPAPAEIMEILGKDETIKRIEFAISKIKK